MDTKKGRIDGKGVPFKGVPQKLGGGKLPQTAKTKCLHLNTVTVQCPYKGVPLQYNKCYLCGTKCICSGWKCTF